ncbi:KilA-N domain-containing protein [Limnothrix sp. FACHB-1083]|uniref:KilA-N domain-containing protein n=1 Tax=unclassified Limnothrix TaxID=2632864 RepID=UPI001680E1D5|nr:MULTISPECIES: KilA-N domain-containing protein [unclassified Limnothrix]MBD2161390.1 KilA-N domain-containing protein [Limnothrix sp. FACHB-1083]MBD2192098.1 KilA-N domain-containing protein [Limnothrix sp. FACHB-1088]
MASPKFITHLFEGVGVEQRSTDGYVNATKLSKAYLAKSGKQREIKQWLLNKDTQEIIEHVSGLVGIPTDRLVVTIKTGPNEHRGTYLHPRISVRFAMWLDKDFGFFVEELVHDFLMGRSAYAEARAHGKISRAIETRAMQQAGFGEKRHFINITQAVYLGLFGCTKSKLMEIRGLNDEDSLRDSMTAEELTMIDLLEHRVASLLKAETFDSYSVLHQRIKTMAAQMRSALA